VGCSGTSPHTFHIPVMGTGFTIDTPLRVARYGISSVISLVDDILIDQVRVHHAREHGLSAHLVKSTDPDPRAHRITQYLELLRELIADQVAHRTAEDRLRYWRLLPPGAVANDAVGSIDVNIMTKLDRAQDRGGTPRAAAHSDALAALRGFAQSSLESSVVLSAGINRKLYEYMATFADFFPDADGRLRKRIILKVSDFRSAAVQGKFLAKAGLWVSEFRVESGLNCGGHAFGGSGQLFGPILATFRDQRESLRDEMGAIWSAALQHKGLVVPPLPEQRLTAQGGVGTASEHTFLMREYGLDSVGWGTPFLLVPEVVAIDATTIAALSSAGSDDVALLPNSPLGLPFWTLRTSASERIHQARIAAGHPGAPCPKGHLADNCEFSVGPLCVASEDFQSSKLAQIDASAMTPLEKIEAREAVLSKGCLCHDLGGGAAIKYGFDSRATPLVCPGPNIVNFSGPLTLEQMVDHIYGRAPLPLPADRPSLFIREFQLSLDHLASTTKASVSTLQEHPAWKAMHEGLVAYYELIPHLPLAERGPFLEGLEDIAQQMGVETREHQLISI